MHQLVESITLTICYQKLITKQKSSYLKKWHKQQSEEVKYTVNKDPVEKVKQNDKTQLQPLKNINQDDKKQQLLPDNTSNPLQQLLNLFGHYTGAFLKKLSASQLKSIIYKLGVTNLTLERSQMRFLVMWWIEVIKTTKS